MKLVEILGKDNLAGLREKLLGFKNYKPLLTEGANYSTLNFHSNETIPEDDFEKIKNIIKAEGFTVIKSDNDFEVEDDNDRTRRPFIRFK